VLSPKLYSENDWLVASFIILPDSSDRIGISKLIKAVFSKVFQK